MSFPTLVEAEQAAKRFAKKYNNYQRAYECHICHHFHLTTQRRYNENNPDDRAAFLEQYLIRD